MRGKTSVSEPIWGVCSEGKRTRCSHHHDLSGGQKIERFTAPRTHASAPVVWKGRLNPLAGPWRLWGAERPQVLAWALCQYVAANNSDMGLILFKDLSLYSGGAQLMCSGTNT